MSGCGGRVVHACAAAHSMQSRVLFTRPMEQL